MSDSIQQLQKGYKQTEVGIIPEDWNLTTYDDSFDFLQTATYSREQLSDNNEINYIHYGDIHTKWNNFLDFSKSVLPSITKNLAKNYPLLKDGDLIVVDASEDYEGVGKSVEVMNLGSKKAISGLHTFLLRDKGIFVDGFRGYIHKNRLVINQFNSLATGMKVYGVSRTNLKTVLIPVPKREEQFSIAKILTETSKLIENLEKLIAKKKAIKQGVMQELLTGKKRLPGFNETWEMKKMGEIGKTYGGLSGKVKAEFGHGNAFYIPFMNIMSNPIINIQDFEKVVIKTKEHQNRAECGDLFFNGSSETPEEVGMCSVLKQHVPNLYLNSFCFGFRFNKEIKPNGIFYSYLFRSNEGRNLMYSLAQGATRYNLSKTSFLDLKVPYPKPEEQTAIANLLSDMDSEISCLQVSLGKYQNIKIGMMQQLLTGKIRIYESN